MGLTISKLIESVGPKKLAELAEINLTSAYSWQNKEVVPDPKYVANLIKNTGGMVSYNSVYGEYFPVKD